MTPDPKDDSNLTGEHARDTHRGGFGGDYARESHEPGSGVRSDNYASSDEKSDGDHVSIGKASE
jgi:hypothetical protein